MITLKQLKEEIITYDIITYDENGNDAGYVEVTLTDRIIEVPMNLKEVNVGLIAREILAQNLYKED
ncbi:hypothetical protein [Cellulosilyticum ruminicola]|uniref:hypothetical protein n=1 Tax=Cellulosilyticum ruminicola TaxID=425254 RepID=UPI0006CFFC1B|nr:hypothetical protein [Cellulosilyticum ruminicola]